MLAVSATSQTGVAGMPVADPPAVKVLNAAGAGVTGVTVTFTATGGLLVGSTVTTDGTGVAKSGSWTIGAGSNTVVASSQGVQPVTFTASGTPAGPAACATLGRVQFPGSQSGALTTASCAIDGYPTELYALTTPTQVGITVTATATAFDPTVRVTDNSGVPIAEATSPAGGPRAAVIRAILPVGNFRVHVRGATPAAAGTYTVASAAADESNASCPTPPIFIAVGVLTRQFINELDCAVGRTTAERYRLYLAAGRTVRITFDDGIIIGSLRLSVFNPDGSLLLTRHTARDGNAAIVTAPASGYYLLDLSAEGLYSAFGYTLTIQ